MSSRVVITIVLAVVLMILVMGVAAAITFTGMAASDKWTTSQNWIQPAASVSSMKVSNITGAGKTDLFAQAGNSVVIFNASGDLLYKQDFPGTLVASLGDVDGDGRQEVIAYHPGQQGRSLVSALKIPGGPTVWQTSLEGLADAARAAVIDFDGTGQVGVVVGDINGKLVAVSSKGEERWRYDLQASELRGLDNIAAGNAQLVAAGDRGGRVVALDKDGNTAWTFTVPGGMRRLRTEEILGPGRSAVLLGSETGTLYVLEGSTGKTLWTAEVGQAIAEIRLAELDGDVGTHELVVGGNHNGVWAYSQAGTRLFAASVSGEKTKITEITALDVDESGRDVVAIGDEDGAVTFFDERGSRLVSLSYAAPINRMATGKIGGQWQFLVADATQVRALTLSKQSPPLWYSPLLGGLLACVVIAIAALLVASIKPPPPLRISAEQMTVEAQKARRIMLHESINELKRMRAAGEVAPEAYLARIKDLRAQLADAEANLIKLGVPLQAETITCPHCGGKLELGTDRCEYCGQTVIV